MAKKQALGSGLGELLGEVASAYEKNLNERLESVIELSVDIIKPNPYQPRKNFQEESLRELAMSIIEHGLLQPILVYEDGGDYFLIAGERRLRASKIAKQSTIRAIVVDIAKERLRELAIIENIQRENLNPIDLARSYQELINDYKITHDDLAKRLKCSRAQITNTLRLLDLSDYVQDLVAQNKITQGHAKVIVGFTNEEQHIIADSVMGQKLSVRETESLAKSLKQETIPQGKAKNKTSKNETIPEIRELQETLQSLGIQARIVKNSITITASKERIIHLIKKLKS